MPCRIKANRREVARQRRHETNVHEPVGLPAHDHDDAPARVPRRKECGSRAGAADCLTRAGTRRKKRAQSLKRRTVTDDFAAYADLP